MRIVVTSDLHGHIPDIPLCDLLIVAGDFTRKDTTTEQKNFYKWLSSFHDYVYVFGNHDNNGIKDDFCLFPGRTVEKFGYTIAGSPYTVKFLNQNLQAMAYVVENELYMEKHHQYISDCDILITHSPPFKILDKNKNNVDCGSININNLVKRTNPIVHVFGHIHEAYGKQIIGETCFLNASFVDGNYQPRNLVYVVDLYGKSHSLVRQWDCHEKKYVEQFVPSMEHNNN